MRGNHIHQTVTAVQFAFEELLERLELVAGHEGEHERLKAELEETVVALVSKVLLHENRLREDELAFMEKLFSWNKTEQTRERVILEHAGKWNEFSRRVPEFFKCAVCFDRKNGTAHARAMLCQMQLAGNNAVISDVGSGVGERKIVRDYVVLLESYAES